MTGETDRGSKATVLTAIIANSRRLLQDARILQRAGSPGSALSLAILAFEEAGKGHIVENGWRKPKQIGSQHAYRHFMAFTVLHASLVQKYGLDLSAVQRRVAKRFEDAGLKPGSKGPVPPMSDELRAELRAELIPQFQAFSDDEKVVFGSEQRWLEKVGNAVRDGALEKIRQSGLYLDTDADLAITGSPEHVERIEVERWLWAATRVLNLLEHGQYDQAYSPLSELMSAGISGDTAASDLLADLKRRP